MVRINGTEEDVAGKTLAEYLEAAHYRIAYIVVERNMEIVPKTEYAATVLQDMDEVEIVSFMGGG